MPLINQRTSHENSDVQGLGRTEDRMSETIQVTPHPSAPGAINRRPKRGRAVPLRRPIPVASSSKVLGYIVSEAVSRQLLTVRSAAKRVGMSPAQMSRVMRGI